APGARIFPGFRFSGKHSRTTQNETEVTRRAVDVSPSVRKDARPMRPSIDRDTAPTGNNPGIAPPAGNARRQLPALTTLRFLAATVVLLVHAERTFPIRLWHCEAAGYYALAFFFVLSGFILRHAYGDLGSWKSCRRFFIARLLRVYPTYLA